MKKVKVYRSRLNLDWLGDFVKCGDCGELQLIELRGETCPCCGSKNLTWGEDENGNQPQEASPDSLEAMGFEIEYN